MGFPAKVGSPHLWEEKQQRQTLFLAFFIYNKARNMFGDYRKILIILGIFVVLVFTGFFLRDIWFKASGGLNIFLGRVAREWTGIFSSIVNSREIYQKNKELENINSELLVKLQRLSSLKSENIALRKALELNLSRRYKLLKSDIIEVDKDQDILFINKGRKDGVRQGMVVITAQDILVGAITKTFNYYSIIRLITNPKSELIAANQSGLDVILKGLGNFKLTLKNFPKGKTILKGETIFTSSISKKIPKNLLIGVVDSVLVSDVDPFKKVTIKPLFLGSLSQPLFIILNWNN